MSSKFLKWLTILTNPPIHPTHSTFFFWLVIIMFLSLIRFHNKDVKYQSIKEQRSYQFIIWFDMKWLVDNVCLRYKDHSAFFDMIILLWNCRQRLCTLAQVCWSGKHSLSTFYIGKNISSKCRFKVALDWTNNTNIPGSLATELPLNYCKSGNFRSFRSKFHKRPNENAPICFFSADVYGNKFSTVKIKTDQSI